MIKPPIGIMPKWLWLEFLEVSEPSQIEIKNRIIELEGAIDRYQKASFRALDEWVNELLVYKNK